MIKDNKGFAYSTMLYGLLAVMIVLLMLIFNLYKKTSDEEYYYSSTIDVKLNDCVDAEVALENCYAANTGPCDVREYYACLGITKNEEDARKVRLIDVLTDSNKIVTSGNGLYKLNDDEYVYRGTSVNNFINFGGKIWRIIGVYNGVVKIADVTNAESRAWDVTNSQEWPSSTLNYYLNNAYFGNLLKHELIQKTPWYIGRVNTSVSLETIGNIEKSASHNDYVGLLSVSDYVYASPSATCHASPFAASNNCNTSYLAAYTTWLINATPSSTSTTNAYYFKANQGFVSTPASTQINFIPVVYLNGSIEINGDVGDGSSGTPYTVLS